MRSAMLGAFVASAFAVSAHADILATFYTAQADGRDFGPVICCFANNDEVLQALGPNGLPVYNPAEAGGHPLQDHSANGELTWFTPGAASSISPGVTLDGTQVISGNSFNDGSMYPPNATGSNDASGFQTAVFTGNFHFDTAQDFTFSLGADDDALMYVDNQAVVILGGIHPNTPASNTVHLDMGDHNFVLFYADRQQTGASLNFSIPNDVIVTAPSPGVPEPATWALLIAGFGGLGAVARRRRAAPLTA